MVGAVRRRTRGWTEPGAAGAGRATRRGAGVAGSLPGGAVRVKRRQPVGAAGGGHVPLTPARAPRRGRTGNNRRLGVMCGSGDAPPGTGAGGSISAEGLQRTRRGPRVLSSGVALDVGTARPLRPDLRSILRSGRYYAALLLRRYPPAAAGSTRNSQHAGGPNGGPSGTPICVVRRRSSRWSISLRRPPAWFQQRRATDARLVPAGARSRASGRSRFRRRRAATATRVGGCACDDPVSRRVHRKRAAESTRLRST